MKTSIHRFLFVLFIMIFGHRTLVQAKKPHCCLILGMDRELVKHDSTGKNRAPESASPLIKGIKHEKMPDDRKIKVLFYLQDGVEILDFAGPLEVFSYAGFDVFIVSKTKGPITSQGVVKIIPDYTIDDAPPADILAFFGGNSGNAANDPAVIDWLKNAPTPEYYFSVCTGAFILGKAGFLDGLTVTTFHSSIENLKKAVPKAKVLSNVRFVDNGKVITTAGISAGIDGALHLVEKIRGKNMAEETAKYMEYDKWVPEQGLILTKSGKQP
jgi:transcriptional regulator GlxA family with amidase domain